MSRKALLDKTRADTRIKNDYQSDRECRRYAKANNLAFIGCFSLFGDDQLYEVYREPAGYVILVNRRTNKVTGMHPDGLKDVRYRTGVQCLICKAIVYSSHKRHLQKCRCNNVVVDGGQEMLRISCEDDSKYVLVTIDLLSKRLI